MKKLNLFFFGISILLFACSQPTSNEIETEISPVNPESIEAPAPAPTTITVSATRIGGSGTGVDIVVRNDNSDEVFIVGENKSIYKYNSSQNKFNQHGGGTAKRISATKNKLLICGNNDRIYHRAMSSTGSWSYLGSSSSKCKDIVGDRDDTNLAHQNVWIMGHNQYAVYYWNSSSWTIVSNSPPMQNGTDIALGLNVAIRGDINIVFNDWYYGVYSHLEFSPSASWAIKDYSNIHEVAGSNQYDYFIDAGRDIVNRTTGQRYDVSSRTPDRLSIANDGTIYFIDAHTRGIYWFNP